MASVLFLVPSGKIPTAPLCFNIVMAFSKEPLCLTCLSTDMQPVILKNQANFESKYSFLAI